ncbi:MAG: hypothetical protein P4M09_17660 [Devosia sp.]|nr:hypothetical protein [Devosia sp.]
MRRRADPLPGPVLELSGPRLRRAFEHLVDAAEATGGVERYVSALALKASLFEEILGKGKVREMTAAEFRDLAAFISPARRRLADYLEPEGFNGMRERLVALLEGWSDMSTADARLLRFMAQFPQDKAHRWVRDLGAEVLHFVAPDHYPLMTRWVWDARVGTGVLREIWYSDSVDDATIAADDSLQTFTALAAELATFLAGNGVFRDHAFYGDLLCAHVYAGYINDRGGQYLRSDFSDGSDPMTHTRRMLGLDAIDTETGRTRLKLIDGSAHVLGAAPMHLS